MHNYYKLNHNKEYNFNSNKEYNATFARRSRAPGDIRIATAFSAAQPEWERLRRRLEPAKELGVGKARHLVLWVHSIWERGLKRAELVEEFLPEILKVSPRSRMLPCKVARWYF
jgi:hypothetical protein